MPLAYFDRFAIELPASVAESCAHPGPCDADVEAAMYDARVQAELDRIPPDDLARELKEYGAWSAEELADHEANCRRIVWLAAGNIRDGRDDG